MVTSGEECHPELGQAEENVERTRTRALERAAGNLQRPRLVTEATEQQSAVGDAEVCRSCRRLRRAEGRGKKMAEGEESEGLP